MKLINIKDKVFSTMSTESTGQVFKCIGSEFHTHFDNVDNMEYHLWSYLRNIKDRDEEDRQED